MISLKTIRVGWLSALALLIGFLLYKAIVPTGFISYHSDFLHYNYFISELTPTDRVRNTTQVIGEPVYFFLRTPRPFRTATIILNTSHLPPIVEVGICRDKAQWQFERQPLYVRDLEELARHSHLLTDGDLVLWQRQPTYNSISDFFDNLPPSDRIATYNYALPTSFQLSDYQPYATPRNFMVGARGSYLISTYSDGQPIKMKFAFQNLESNLSHDMVITVYNEGGQVIQSETVTEFRPEVKIVTPALIPGAYQIEFKAGDEIITSAIETVQSRWAFVHNVWLADTGRRNFSLMTDGSYLKAQTINPTHLQTIGVNEQSLAISETYRQFTLDFLNQRRESKKLEFATDDVMIATDGVIALSDDELFNSMPYSYHPGLDVDTVGVDYLLGRYRIKGQTQLKPSVTFNLSTACLDNGRYPFLIAAPGVSAEEPLEVKDITVQLHGQNVWEFLNTVWNRLKR